MVDRLEYLLSILRENGSGEWCDSLRDVITTNYSAESHGNFEKWNCVIESLQSLKSKSVPFVNNGRITFESKLDIAIKDSLETERTLLAYSAFFEYEKYKFRKNYYGKDIKRTIYLNLLLQ